MFSGKGDNMTLRNFINSNHHTTIGDEFITVITIRQASEYMNYKELVNCSYAIDLQNKFYEISRDYRIFKRYKNFNYHKELFTERYSFRDIARERESDF